MNWSADPVFVIDTAYFIDQGCSSVNLRWLYWLLHAAKLDAISQDTGVPGLAREFVHDMQAVRPSVRDQQCIAAFLDRETTKIDHLIAEQERLVALLDEKRRAVIVNAVTKGLIPDTPMKECGIGWIGEIPASWTALSLKRIALTMCDGPFGSGLKSSHYTTSGTRVVRLQNIRDFEFNGADEAYVDQDYFDQSLSHHDVKGGEAPPVESGRATHC